MRNNLPDETSKKNFDNAFRNTKKQSGRMHGSADFIRSVKHIDNQQEFFQALGADGNSKFKFDRRGQVNLNNELIIHPKAFIQIEETQRMKILEYSSDLMNKKITVEQFNTSVSQIQKQNRIVFENQRKSAYSKISKSFGVTRVEDFNINGRKIFSNLKPDEIDRLDNVLQYSAKNYDENCIHICIEFAKSVECKSIEDFCAALEYIVRQMNKEVSDRINANPNPQRPSNVKAKDFYTEQVYKEFKISSNGKLAGLKAAFDQLQNECHKADNKGFPQFGNKMAAANHYDKHHDDFRTIDPKNSLKIDTNNPLSVEEYFRVAREMTSMPVTPENSKITQNGASVCITYEDKYNNDKSCVTAIRYDNLADGQKVIATLMLVNKKGVTNISSFIIDTKKSDKS